MEKLDPRYFICRATPPTLDVDNVDWTQWKEDWETFKGHSGINRLLEADYTKPPSDEVTTAMRAAKRTITVDALKTTFTPSTAKVVRNLPLTQAERQDATTIICGLEEYLEAGTNKRVYRKEFQARIRTEDETCDAYMIALKDMARKCKFTQEADPESERILDQVVAGINDREITEKLLQLPNTATLDDALKLARNIMASRRNAEAIIARPTTDTPMASRLRQNTRVPPKEQIDKNKRGTCGKCGHGKDKPWHQTKGCPAAKATCRHCNKKGHYDRCCPTFPDAGGRPRPTAQTNAITDTSEDEGALSSIVSEINTATLKNPLDPLEKLGTETVTIAHWKGISSRRVSCLADTGSNTTCVPLQDLSRLGLTTSDLTHTKPPPQSPRQADGQPNNLRTVGIFRARVSWAPSNRETIADVYVIDGLAQPMLSRQVCRELQIFVSPHRPTINNTQ
uniref:CCHC-type domain-containing protein n=1 Tax=Photinus pyralis TaxID=7054 RepID=A0A1Y1MW38_PHOPY